MKKTGLKALLLGLAAFAGQSAWGSITQSISTTFVEVLVEGAPLASRYAVEGKLVDVTNKGETTLFMRFDALAPSPSELRAGYEPIPDIGWVGFEPRTVEVAPGETKSTKVVLYLPESPEFAGRRFQTMLFIHSDPAKGSMAAMGLKPRLLFSVADKGDKAAAKVVNNPPYLARILPYELIAGSPVIGFDCGNLVLSNSHQEELTYEFVRDPSAFGKIDEKRGEIPIPDLNWVEVYPPVLILRPGTKSEMAVTARLPLDEKHFGKSYVAALRFSVKRQGAKTVEAYNKVRINVPKLPSLGRTATGASRDM